VTAVARSSWFGAIYREPKNFFAQFAVADNYLDLYPEFVLPEDQRQAYLRDRKGCLVGRQLADQFVSRWATCCPCAAPFIREPGNSWCAVFSTA